MIITLKDTTNHEIASRIVSPRENRDATALRRILTLIIIIPDLTDVGCAIEISDAASCKHPCRVIVIVDSPDTEGAVRLNAQIHIGDAVGPSDVIILEPRGQAAFALDTLVMPFLLSGIPVVTYWLVAAPHNPDEHPLDRIAIRRVTDSKGSECPLRTLLGLSQHYTPRDMGLGWAGVTLWHVLPATIAAEFGQMPVSVLVKGHETHPSPYLVAA